jgi:hypothetical protein
MTTIDVNSMTIHWDADDCPLGGLCWDDWLRKYSYGRKYHPLESQDVFRMSSHRMSVLADDEFLHPMRFSPTTIKTPTGTVVRVWRRIQ